MLAPPAPPVAWPQALDIATTALPFVAAWLAGRRSWRDPVAQVGIAWGVQFLCSMVQLAGKLAGEPVLLRGGGLAAALLLPVCLVPPLLAWIGPSAKRWQGAILAANLAAALGLLALVGQGRAYTLFYKTPMHFGLLLLTVLGLMAQARQASDPRAEAATPGWLWIGGAHLVYFLTFVVGRPLIEVLVPVSWGAVVDAHMGTMLIYSATMVAAAWGLWLSRARRPAAPHGAALPTAG